MKTFTKALLAESETILRAAQRVALNRAETASGNVVARGRALTEARQRLKEAEISAAGRLLDTRVAHATSLVSAAVQDEVRAKREEARAVADADQAAARDLPTIQRATTSLAHYESRNLVETARIVAAVFFARADQARGGLHALEGYGISPSDLARHGARLTEGGELDLHGEMPAARDALLSILQEKFSLDKPSLEERCERLEAQVQELTSVVSALAGHAKAAS